MSYETLPAYAALWQFCEDVGLHPVGTTCDNGVICGDTLEKSRVVEHYGRRLVPLQPDLTIVFGKRS